MNIPKIDITQDQKKIIIISAVVVFVFLLFFFIFYLPASKKISNLKIELNSTQSQIQGIEMLLAGSGSRDEAIRLLKEKQGYLINKFPQKEEESLRLIPEYARKMNIEVISLQPGLKTEFLDEADKKVIIEGKVASYLPITIEVSCFYKDLVKYLLELKSKLPAFVSVISLNVKKDRVSIGKVRAIIELNLYLLI